MITEELIAYMGSKGLTPTETLLLGPDITRFHISGDTLTKKNGWVILIEGDFPVAHFGSWKTGKNFIWNHKHPSTPAERVASQKAIREARAKYISKRKHKNAQAKETANILWNKAVPADRSHAYLFEKKVCPHGIRQLDGALLIPLFYGGEIVSLQAIYPSGQKTFLAGGRVSGCYFPLEPAPEAVQAIYIGEGFATVAALKENLDVEGGLFVVAFTANNLKAVAQGYRTDYPNTYIAIAADNDRWTPGNPGITKAREAGAIIGADVIYPDFEGLDISDQPTDFSDYVNLGGAICL